MCGPRQAFFFQCSPEMPKGWTPLLEGYVPWTRPESGLYHFCPHSIGWNCIAWCHLISRGWEYSLALCPAGRDYWYWWNTRQSVPFSSFPFSLISNTRIWQEYRYLPPWTLAGIICVPQTLESEARAYRDCHPISLSDGFFTSSWSNEKVCS